MIVWGIVFLILGFGSFILPSLGLQFAVLTFFGSATPTIAIVLIVVGAILTIFGIIGEIRRKMVK